MNPAKTGWCCQNDDVARLQTVHCFLVTIETDEAAIFRNIKRSLRAKALVQVTVTVLQILFEDICHGDQLNWAVVDRQRLSCRAGSTATATDKGDLQCIIFIRISSA